MLGYPRNNFTYLGPSGIGIWAHHTKWNWFGKTSGFGKPVTRKRKGNPRNCFFWGILGLFSRKSFSQWPNTLHLQLRIHDNAKKTSVQLKKMPVRQFKEVHKTTESSSGLHMQEIVSFLNSLQKLFVTGEKTKLRRENHFLSTQTRYVYDWESSTVSKIPTQLKRIHAKQF